MTGIKKVSPTSPEENPKEKDKYTVLTARLSLLPYCCAQSPSHAQLAVRALP